MAGAAPEFPPGLAGAALHLDHLVVGAGEVGTAVHEVLSRGCKAGIRDLEECDATADVLDVCIPWQDGFADRVRGYARQHGADLVVVHSTVPVGTCDAEGWVHSPVRGRHPALAEGVATFPKHFGGDRAAEASLVWQAIGVPIRTYHRAAETEAGKLWELVQYGVQIRVEQAIHAWCEEHGLDADVVYRRFALSYNAGYAALGEGRFVRPVLEHVPGPIGGHCVTPMSYLLDHPLADMVREGM